jgi:hypothetical protein
MNIESIHRLLGDIFKRNTLVVRPTSKDASDAPPAEKENAPKYEISGKIRIPHRDGTGEVHLRGTLALDINKTGHPEITELEGSVLLGTWDLAQDILLSDAEVRLVAKNGPAAALISGALRRADCGGPETGGTLNAELLYDPKDPDRMYIGALATEAYLNIGKSFRFHGATIRFELCTKPHGSAKPLPYLIDELDELLIQSDKPFPLASWHVSGIGEQPLTLSIGINALTPGRTRTSLSVYSARLRIPFFGEKSSLFISGDVRENRFVIDLGNTWETFVTSSPHLWLVLPSDPHGPSLIEGISFFTGTLHAHGLSRASLTLSSDLIEATAFPAAAWPQRLPAQRIAFSLSTEGNIDLILKFNPLSIDGFSITSTLGKNVPLESALNERGLLFKKGYFLSRESAEERSLELPAFFIDNYCRVWVEAGEDTIELAQWVGTRL